jgi:hypothetical protein
MGRINQEAIPRIGESQWWLRLGDISGGHEKPRDSESIAKRKAVPFPG